MASGIALSRDPFRSLRWRFARRFAALAAVIVLACGGVLYLYVRHALLGATERALHLATVGLLEKVGIKGSKPTVDREEFEEEFDEVNLAMGVVLAQVWDSNGRLIGEHSLVHERIPREGPEREIRTVGGHKLMIRRQPIGPNGAAIGLLVVGLGTEHVADDLSLLSRALQLVIPLVILAAFVAGWVMAAQAIGPVRRAFEQQRAFIADASHELRTPLSIIQAQTQVALDGDDDASRMRQALSVVERTVRQLGRLVEDMLFLSRTDATTVQPQRRSFQLEMLAEETVEAFIPLAEEKGLQLKLMSSPGGVSIVADPDQLQRLLGIILDNAVRYADPGPVDIALKRVGQTIELRVTDSGPGIPPSLLPRVFDRFVRGDSARSHQSGGHGLGLSIARNIVEAHQGTIELTSAPGAGTVVAIRLPRPPMD